MPRHRTRDIAALSGLSEASVDRVLHSRGQVRGETLQAVEAAIAQLDRQHLKTEQGSRKLAIEVVAVDDPYRVSAIRAALQKVRPELRPRVVDTYVRTVPPGRPDLAAAELARVHARRPQGLLVDLDDDPAVVEQATFLVKAGIPVVTTYRPFPRVASLGHSGLDNRSAGATAGYLLSRALAHGGGRLACSRPGTALEQDRVHGFTATVVALRPGTEVTVVNDGRDQPGDELQRCGGVYLVGDDDDAAAAAVRLRSWLPRTATVVAHRSSPVLALLAERVVDFALDVSWEGIVKEGCEAVLRFHRRGPGQAIVYPVSPMVLTPFNLQV